MKRFIPVAAHGLIDHVTGPVLLVAPEVFRMRKKDAPSAIAPRVVGAEISALNAFSDHPFAAKRAVPMKAHLAIDAVLGVALGALPWITGDAKRGKRYWLPHAIVGGKELFLAAFTRTSTPTGKPRRRAMAAKAVGRAARRAPRTARGLVGAVR